MSDDKFKNEPILGLGKTVLEFAKDNGLKLNNQLAPGIPTFNISHNITELDESISELLSKEKEEEIVYRNTVIQSLQGIEKNTAFLAEMTLILQKNKENQDDIFNLLIEVLEIMKSQNKEEAESRYRKIMKKISSYSGDIESIQTLYGITQTAFNAYNSLPFT